MTRVQAPEYPKTVQLGNAEVVLRLMQREDGKGLLAFARALPPHDLLFLRRDITRQAGVDAWLGDLEQGLITTILAEERGEFVGYATVHRGDLDWSRHVAELRVMVTGKGKGRGLGRVLIENAFAVALALGIEKLYGRMTLDQMAARTLFEELGFKPEGLLRDEVKDRTGKKHDVLLLGHDIATSPVASTFLAE